MTDAPADGVEATTVPLLPPGPLDALWIQLGGTLCNLECTHCFISCSPKNRSLDLMTADDVEPLLCEAERLGVREYYFTGGEIFIVKELESIVERTMGLGPVTLLTNGTLITAERARRLAEIERASRYSLEFRVSLDGFCAEDNDAIRGRGAFERAMRGFQCLIEVGFLPIITATEVWEPERGAEVLSGFTEELRRRGCDRPRLKILPRL
ncbi:MAG: radical SAM protein, partial [Planctomycetes bacterium]|nr:radical SAM protein [Planctomycetota bacterium]